MTQGQGDAVAASPATRRDYAAIAREIESYRTVASWPTWMVEQGIPESVRAESAESGDGPTAASPAVSGATTA